MKKILVEIIKLLWKLFKLTLWKWLRPMLGKLVVAALIFCALAAVVGFLIAGSC